PGPRPAACTRARGPAWRRCPRDGARALRRARDRMGEPVRAARDRPRGSEDPALAWPDDARQDRDHRHDVVDDRQLQPPPPVTVLEPRGHRRDPRSADRAGAVAQLRGGRRQLRSVRRARVARAPVLEEDARVVLLSLAPVAMSWRGLLLLAALPACRFGFDDL